MLDSDNKDIGKVAPSDINDIAGELNNTSDINMEELQYTSKILDKMKSDGVYDSLCALIKAVKMADKSDAFLISQIRKKFNTYCSGLTQQTFKRWLGGEYKEIVESYHFGRDIALGELLAIGMNVARKNKNSIDGGEFALKLIDRLDTGLINPRNNPEISGKDSSGMSNEAAKTMAKVFNALSQVSEPSPPDGELISDAE